MFETFTKDGRSAKMTTDQWILMGLLAGATYTRSDARRDGVLLNAFNLDRAGKITYRDGRYQLTDRGARSLRGLNVRIV